MAFAIAPASVLAEESALPVSEAARRDLKPNAVSRHSELKTRTIPSKFILSLFVATLLSMLLQHPSWATNPPAFSVPTGVFSRPTQAQLSMTMEPGSTTYFTTDGSTPSDTHGTVYSVPISLGSKNVIKAVSYLSGVPSSITTAFIQNDPTAQPVPPSGLQLWVKGDFGVLTNGSAVSEWVDFSGSGNNLVQGTGANQPGYVGTAINDFAAVSFDGTNDSLSWSSGLGPNLTTGVSIFAVIKPSATGTSAWITSGNTGPADQVSMETLNTQAQFSAFNGTTGSSVTTPTASLTIGKFQTLSAVHTGGASASINVNGYSIASGVVENLINTSRSQNYLGANNNLSTFWNGEIAELLCYSRAVTTEERAAIEAYLFSRYQMQTAQSTPPPVLNVASGTYTEPVQVAIAADADSEIRFTIDGTAPSGSSQLYSQPINAYYSQTVKCIAIRNGISSSVVSATLTLDPNKFPAPDPLDTKQLNINMELPTVAIPQ